MSETIEVTHESGGPILIPKEALGEYERRGYKVVIPRATKPKSAEPLSTDATVDEEC